MIKIIAEESAKIQTAFMRKERASKKGASLVMNEFDQNNATPDFSAPQPDPASPSSQPNPGPAPYSADANPGYAQGQPGSAPNPSGPAQQPYYGAPGSGYQQQPPQPPYGAPGYQQPPQQPYYPPQPNYPVYTEQKSRIAAGLLGIFLGAFGVHNFYLGYTGKAVAQLVITLVTCGAGAVVTEIWGLIEGIMILCGSISTDSQGIPLKD